MQDLTSQLPAKWLTAIQKLTGWKNFLLLGISEDAHEEIFAFWVKLRHRNPSWSCRAIDEEVGKTFGICQRTVRNIRLKFAQVCPTTI
jgi:hypothetical protein